ncbi:MAG: aldo/keto reductase [Bacteroidota bacterium]
MKLITAQNATIPALGLGTYQLVGDANVDLMVYALESGYRHLDTAQMYQNEEEVGKSIKNATIKREDIFLTTKVLPANLGKSTFMPSVEESLKKLQTEQVDLLLIHWPNFDFELEEYVTELMTAQEKGYAKHIGVSNFPVALLEESLKLGAKIVANQVEYHPFLNQSKLLAACQKHDIVLTAYSPIAQGKVVGLPLLKEIGAKYDKSESQVCLRWLIQQEKVAAIPRSSKKERVDGNSAIFDFELTGEEMASLSEIYLPDGRLVDPPNGPNWD